jgi:hypothetical protein
MSDRLHLILREQVAAGAAQPCLGYTPQVIVHCMPAQIEQCCASALQYAQP